MTEVLEAPLASRVAAEPFPVLRPLPFCSRVPLEASERESSATAPRRGGAIARKVERRGSSLVKDTTS